MIDVHPTETAGDGKRIFRKVQKPGDLVIEYIRCAQCGFLFREDRDLQGNTENSALDGLETVTQTISNDASKLPVHLRDNPDFLVSSAEVTQRNGLKGAGCPFCRSHNPTGRFRNEPVFGLKDLSNR